MNKTIQQRAMKHSLLLTAGTLLLECLVSEVVLHDFMIVVPYIPIWGPLWWFFYYGILKYYYGQKNIFFENIEPTQEAYDEAKAKWKKHRYFLFYRAMDIGMKMFALALVVYVFAYLFDSNNITSSIFTVILIASLLVVSIIGRGYFMKKAN